MVQNDQDGNCVQITHKNHHHILDIVFNQLLDQDWCQNDVDSYGTKNNASHYSNFAFQLLQVIHFLSIVLSSFQLSLDYQMISKLKQQQEACFYLSIILQQLMANLKGINWKARVEEPQFSQKFVKTNQNTRKANSLASRSMTISSRQSSRNQHLRPYSSQLKNRSRLVRTQQIQECGAKMKKARVNSRYLVIKQCVQVSNLTKNRQNKLKLSALLQKIHPLFCKMNKSICDSLVLLGKTQAYNKNSILTLSCSDPEDNQFITLNPRQNYIGFILYGKVELRNPIYFYSHTINLNSNSRNLNTTIFEHNYIRENQKNLYRYDVKIQEPALILWVSRETLYLIRKQSFLRMDLKYMFHEFQNFLKFALIHKKAKIASN